MRLIVVEGGGGARKVKLQHRKAEPASAKDFITKSGKTGGWDKRGERRLDQPEVGCLRILYPFIFRKSRREESCPGKKNGGSKVMLFILALLFCALPFGKKVSKGMPRKDRTTRKAEKRRAKEGQGRSHL